jgi:hypothetical protein
MLSNTKHVLDKKNLSNTGDRGQDSQFGFELERRTRSLLEDLNSETLLQSMAHFGPQSIRTSSAFSQTHE